MLVYGSLAKAWRKQTVALDANKKVLVCAHSKDDVAKCKFIQLWLCTRLVSRASQPYGMCLLLCPCIQLI